MECCESGIDTLTGVADNRALIYSLKHSKRVNFLLINIDGFSSINNAYGYEIGDEVLKAFSKYLDLLKPDGFILFRHFADQFILMSEDLYTHEDAKVLAESILSFFSSTELVIEDEIEFKLSLSIGISNSMGLINIVQAEMAILELREKSRHGYIIFNSTSQFVHDKQQHIYWIHKLKEAVSEENIVAYFQPIINNKTQKIEKYECLARIHDDDEVISPFLFLKAAHDSGNLSYVTRSLIAQSFKKFHNTEYEFSINITSDDLQLEYLELLLVKNAQKYKIDPSRVVLELLEDITTLDNQVILNQLDHLRALGFKIAIDDFGAESSNLSRLLEIDPDYIKIDGAFIKNILEDKKSQVIVDAVIMICRANGIKIIAEYIHNEDVQNKIVSLGIDYSQGYYFGAPQPELL